MIQRSFTSQVRSTLSEFIHITEQQLSLDSPCCFAGRDPLHRTIWRHATIRWLILSPCSIAKMAGLLVSKFSIFWRRYLLCYFLYTEKQPHFRKQISRPVRKTSLDFWLELPFNKITSPRGVDFCPTISKSSVVTPLFYFISWVYIYWITSVQTFSKIWVQVLFGWNDLNRILRSNAKTPLHHVLFCSCVVLDEISFFSACGFSC